MQYAWIMGRRWIDVILAWRTGRAVQHSSRTLITGVEIFCDIRRWRQSHCVHLLFRQLSPSPVSLLIRRFCHACYTVKHNYWTHSVKRKSKLRYYAVFSIKIITTERDIMPYLMQFTVSLLCNMSVSVDLLTVRIHSPNLWPPNSQQT